MINYLKEKFFEFIFTNKKYVKDSYGKNIFSVRNFGGATAIRAEKFYTHEPDTVKWINGFKKNSLFLDIGANIGIYSLYAAYKNCNVLAIEPHALNYAVINLNILDNKFQKKITAFPISANNKRKASYLYYSKNLKFGGAHTTFGRKISDDGNKFQSKFKSGSYAITTDEILKEMNLSPTHIKIDVDGNELNVIQGMKKTLLSKKLKSVLIEVNPKFKEHQKCIKILNKIFLRSEKANYNKGVDVYNLILSK